jgi:hypothetical protein
MGNKRNVFTVIRIAIIQAAFDAICAALPLGSVA